MTLKNLAIADFTATAVLFLTAVFFLGFHIWLSSAGVGLAVAIAVIAFSGAALSLRRQNSIPSGSGNVTSGSLPSWVRTWQRIGFLLILLLLLTFFFFK
jgi:hypothetical protein